MLGMATEWPEASRNTATGEGVAPIVRTYLAAAGGDPHRALVDVVADALLELDACATALREREHQVSAGYVRAGRPMPDRP